MFINSGSTNCNTDVVPRKEIRFAVIFQIQGFLIWSAKAPEVINFPHNKNKYSVPNNTQGTQVRHLKFMDLHQTVTLHIGEFLA